MEITEAFKESLKMGELQVEPPYTNMYSAMVEGAAQYESTTGRAPVPKQDEMPKTLAVSWKGELVPGLIVPMLDKESREPATHSILCIWTDDKEYTVLLVDPIPVSEEDMAVFTA